LDAMCPGRPLLTPTREGYISIVTTLYFAPAASV
jgi:hypothetical protein